MIVLRCDIAHRRLVDLEVSDYTVGHIEVIVMEVILRAEKCSMHKQVGTPIFELIHVIDNLLNNSLTDYSNVILLGNLNINVSKPNHPLEELFQVTGFQNILSAPICFKYPNNPNIIDVVTTNVAKRLNAPTCTDTGVSDFHMMGCFATKININITINKPKNITYRSISAKTDFWLTYRQPHFMSMKSLTMFKMRMGCMKVWCLTL